MKITVKKIEQERVGSRFVTKEESIKEISKEQYYNMIDPKAIRFFRNLGGIETVQKNYTCYGYLPVRILSTSPDRTVRIIKEFSIGE